MNLKVENLANIRSAEVDIKPLTIFVGRNNTNKSYLAHVVYMVYKILNEGFVIGTLLPEEFIDELFKEYILLDTEHVGKKDVHIKPRFRQKPKKVLNYFLANVKDFLSDGVRQGFRSQRIRNFRVDVNIDIKDEDLKELEVLTIEMKPVNKRFLSGFIFHSLIEKSLGEIICKPFYFPASRTGFVLAFDDIVSGIFRERYGGQPTTRLTEPTIDFLSYFARIKTGDSVDVYVGKHRIKREEPIDDLISFIERNLLNGEIWHDKNTKEFSFHPKGTRGRKKIELHLTSSCITELLPIYQFLKNFSRISDKLLIIEEPEAHLHPANQLMIADLISMIVNAGGRVLITTHSDYIVSRINNNIKKFLLSKKKSKTFLDPQKVSAYLFKKDNKRVEVQELSIDEQGISMENFEEVVSELLEESSLLDVKLEAKAGQKNS